MDCEGGEEGELRGGRDEGRFCFWFGLCTTFLRIGLEWALGVGESWGPVEALLEGEGSGSGWGERMAGWKGGGGGGAAVAEEAREDVDCCGVCGGVLDR